MKKLIINGEEVTPGKKVKLYKHMTSREIDALIKKKQDEQKSEKREVQQDPE